MYGFFCYLDILRNKEQLDYRAAMPLSSVSSIGTGGKADIFVLPNTHEALVKLLDFAYSYGVPTAVVGNSSNLIYSDEGFRGAVISTKNMKNITVREREYGAEICVSAGVMLPVLAERALEMGLCGFEGLCSIPGTVGGAILSNAGAYGQSISDFIYGMFVFTRERKVCFRRADKGGFSYRKCNILSDGDVVLSVLFSLKKGHRDGIAEKMSLCRKKRAETQPIGVRSAGSFFKRPKIHEGSPYFGMSAGELIQLCGLKGMRFGSAAVSEKHGNFIINEKNASAYEIRTLADILKKRVFEKTGILLCEEVVFADAGRI